ncbi:MAG: ROK family protein [Rikenellaceae bacterium]
MYKHDNRIVVTLDAGGTNFVFGAIRSNDFIVEPYSTPANSHDLDACLQSMVDGFEHIISQLPAAPVAISFAFPGPADYPNGIIGGYLPNFPSFRDGVALGPFLSERFNLPVYINNDGDLFAYGEAIGGTLPEVNRKLAAAGSPKRFKNLIGYTFGTGFGVGIVTAGKLHIGDNSCVETFCLQHKDMPNILVEEGVAVRAVKRVYTELSGDKRPLEPKDIFDIAEGKLDGVAEAAKGSFAKMGEIAGNAIASAATLIDGIIVIGGGITAAKKYIMPALLKELRSKMLTLGGEEVNKVQMEVFDLDNPEEVEKFIEGNSQKLKVWGSDKTVMYDPMKRIGISISEIGASKAISIGAYAFALNDIDINTEDHEQ